MPKLHSGRFSAASATIFEEEEYDGREESVSATSSDDIAILESFTGGSVNSVDFSPAREPDSGTPPKTRTALSMTSMTINKMEDAHARVIFQAFDQTNAGAVRRSQLISVITKAFEVCTLTVAPDTIAAMAKLMITYGRGNGNTKTPMDFAQFSVLYQAFLTDQSSGSDTHVRSSLQTLVRQNHPEVADPHPILSRMKEASVLYKLELWFQNHKLRLIWGGLYILANCIGFFYKYDDYCNQRPNIVGKPGICFARGFAQMCLGNAFIVLFPLMRSFVQSMRESWCTLYFPVDDAITIHRIVGYVLLLSGLLHTGFQLWALFDYQELDPESQEYRNTALFYIFGGVVPDIMTFLLTIPGWTGIAMVLITLIATPFTLAKVRNSNFNIFVFTHLLFYPFLFALLWIHGISSWLEQTQAWIFLTMPIVIFTIDRWNRTKLYGRAANTRVLSVGLDPDTLELRVEKPKSLDHFIPGMYVYLNVPELSTAEWHPFTISSAPDDDYLGMHIRAVGDWTKALYFLCRIKKDTGLKDFNVKIEGPVGAPSQMYQTYKIVVMIGAGIGVTPMASILRDTAYRLSKNKCDNCKTVHYDEYVPHLGIRSVLSKLYFHWTTKSQDSLKWFANSMNEIAALDTERRIEIHNHLTSVPTKEATIAKTVQTLYHQTTGRDVVSGLETPTRTHFGRPDWDAIFSDLRTAHPHTDVGVFFCGPRSFEGTLSHLCKKYSTLDNKFNFHAENF